MEIKAMLENSLLYTMYDLYSANMLYINALAKMYKDYYYNSGFGLEIQSSATEKLFFAFCELTERMTNYYSKPEFNINYIKMESNIVEIKEEVTVRKNFCRLLHFVKDASETQQKMLLIAPMAGHHATLLRNTVETMLPLYDVYITDWIDAKNIPISKGLFNLDDYIDYIIEFLELLSPDVHVIAVCQPTVPALAAISIMSANNSRYLPKTLTLIGGPIDTRESPTQVNSFVTERSLIWFATNFITRVPLRYPGALRRVYPGFINLTGFMSMNLNKHITEHLNLFRNIMEGNEEKADLQKSFYNEFLSVSDMTAEFYLQTVYTVFQDHALPNGTMISRGRKIDTKAVEKVRLLAIEGEKDNISGIGQTKAVLNLCSNLPENKKAYLLQKGVGHYGLFSGSKFRTQIAPAINQFILG